MSQVKCTIDNTRSFVTAGDEGVLYVGNTGSFDLILELLWPLILNQCLFENEANTKISSEIP
jgi:hypothetical protein